MNILTIIVIAIIGVCAIQGVTEGFVKTAFRLLLNIAVFVLSIFLTPILLRLVIFNIITEGLEASTQWIIVLVVFALLRVGVRFIVTSLDLIAKLPILKSLNKLLGLVTGIVEGVAIVWVVFCVAALLPETPFGMWVESMSASNTFIETLYQNNILLDALNKYIHKI